MAVKEPKVKEPKVKKVKKEKPPKKERPPKKIKPNKKRKAAGAEPELEQEGKKKKKGPPLLVLIIGLVIILAAIALVVVFVVLPRLGGEKDPDPDVSPEPSDPGVYYELPESFDVGGETVPGMEPLIAANVQAENSVQVIYTYIDLTDAGAEAANYVSKLVSESKFYVVDEEFVRTDAPDFTVPEGEVLLARNLPKAEAKAPAEGDAPAKEPVDMVLTVRLSWQPGTCVIVGDQAEGKVTSPPRDDRPSGGGASMSLNGAQDYLKGLSPSVLGLSGDSMESYQVYAVDGTVLVNGQPCIRLKVYSRNNTQGTNVLAGTYLLSNNGQKLYQLNEATGKVTELKLP